MAESRLGHSVHPRRQILWPRWNKFLDVYKRPYDPRFPVVCMDESPRQFIDEVRIPVPCSQGKPARHDYEYKRCGTCNIFMGNEPLAGTRMVDVTERKTKKDWALFIEEDCLSLRRC